ncbi:MAG: glycine zipper 2TM domain-containing protein [Phenylobacterium sp.]|nr:glycine zipper 2TM domain-containing protein [Phenylobacterium sp.]
MNSPLSIGLASALALATALPAAAQAYRPTEEYQRQQREYEAQKERYDAQNAQYQEKRQDYREARRDNRAARRDYDRRLAEWDRARLIYDRRYGSGSYARMYARPVWDQNYWTSNQPPPYAGNYGQNSASNIRCDSNNNNTVAGGLIGALAGAVLGSQVASRGVRTEGAVLGGVVGAGLGAAIGNSNDRNSSDRAYRCDDRGPYFSYDETVPYREGRQRFSSSYDAGYYNREGCRLAAAPVDAYGRDVRYVRVCPDSQRRYRITG